MINHDVITEIPPITEQDSFVVFERRKSNFNYPIHVHREYEINYISGAKGCVRVVGDSISEIQDKEMVLIASPNLEHAWVDGENTENKEIYEITIQFSSELFSSGGLIDRKQFTPIKKMLQDAKHGIAFSPETIEQCEVCLHKILNSKDSFNSVLIFLSMMNTMANDSEYKVLSNSQFSQYVEAYDSRRVKTITEFLNQNYSRPVRLNEVASLVSMSEASFSRFIKKRTGCNFVENLNNVRIGVASRLLIDEPANTIAEIAYKCGFNNLSNFNRIFKKRKGCTPHSFREYYRKNKIII